MNLDYVVLVDKDDQEIGVAEKMSAHQNGQLHRAFSVFIVREHLGKIEVLLQQRNQNKYHCGGLWTNTCCSHPRPGENLTAAVLRRLAEELEISATVYYLGKFQYLAHFANGLSEHELDHVFFGILRDHAFNLNSDEVQAVQWIELELISPLVQQAPADFTPWFMLAFQLLLDNTSVIIDSLRENRE